MATILALDLTGRLPANRVSETFDVGLQGRVFPLDKGSYFTNSVRITNAITHVQLRKDIDYKLVEQDINAQRMAEGHDICQYVYLISNVPRITVDYQAVGGIFQFNGTALYDMIMEYINNRPADIITGLPTQYPATKHIQNINDFNKLGNLETALKRIEAAIRNGKSEAMTEAMMNYVEDLGNDLGRWADREVISVEDQLQRLTIRNDYRDGRYYINSSPANPSITKGGAWSLDSNVMIYGAMSSSDVGAYEEIVAGSGEVAKLKHLWRRNDFGDAVTYNLTSTATSVNEGGSVTFNLITTGLSESEVVPYYIRGIQATDIAGGVLEGNFVIDNQGRSSITIDIVEDYTSEGTEVLTLILTNAPTNSVSVTINDTSIDPVYQMFFTADEAGDTKITQVNEGEDFYIQVRGVAIPEGQRMYLLTGGSTTADSDFETPIPGFVDIFGNVATIKMRTINDFSTEDDETLVLSLCKEPIISTRVVSASLVVKDTSRTSTYTSKFVLNADGSGTTINQVNEGNVVYLVISGTNVIDGTVVSLDYSGTANANDFMAARPSTVVMQNNRAIVPYSIKNDTTTEGNEALVISMREGVRVVSTSTLIILDTSIDQEFDVWFSSNTAGTDRIATVPEGSQCYLQVRTVGVANGTVYSLIYSGTTTADDFDNARPVTIQINNNSGFVTYQVKNDRLTEDTETFIVTLDNPSQPTASIQILDTSASPSITLRWSSNAQGTDTISSTPEGRSAFLIIQSLNIFDGDRVALTYSGTVSENDFDEPRATTATIEGGRGVVEYKVRADNALEGTENMYVKASFLSAESTSSRLDILDTSTPPKLTMSASVLNVVVTKINGGDLVTVRITDINKQVAANAVIYLNWRNAAIGESDVPVLADNAYTTLPPSTVIMSNWTASFTFSLSASGVTAKSKMPLVAALSREEANTTVSDTATAVVLPLTVEPIAFTGYFSLLGGKPLVHLGTNSGRIYYVVKSPSTPSGTQYRIRATINGVTVNGGDSSSFLTAPLPQYVTFSGGAATGSIMLSMEFIPSNVFPLNTAHRGYLSHVERFNMSIVLLSDDGSIVYESSRATLDVAQTLVMNPTGNYGYNVSPNTFLMVDAYGPSGSGGWTEVWGDGLNQQAYPGVRGLITYTANTSALSVEMTPGGSGGRSIAGTGTNGGGGGGGGVIVTQPPSGNPWKFISTINGKNGAGGGGFGQAGYGAVTADGLIYSPLTTTPWSGAMGVFRGGRGGNQSSTYGGGAGSGGYMRAVVFNPTSMNNFVYFSGGTGGTTNNQRGCGEYGASGCVIYTAVLNVSGTIEDL